MPDSLVFFTDWACCHPNNKTLSGLGQSPCLVTGMQNPCKLLLVGQKFSYIPFHQAVSAVVHSLKGVLHLTKQLLAGSVANNEWLPSIYSMDKTLLALAESYFHSSKAEWHSLAGDGSARKYYLIQHQGQKIVGVDFADAAANDRFFSFSQGFAQNAVPVPKVLQYQGQRFFLLEYLGPLNFAEQIKLWEAEGIKPAAKIETYRAVLPWLAKIFSLGPSLMRGFPDRIMDIAAFSKDFAYFEEHYLAYFQISGHWNKACDQAKKHLLGLLGLQKTVGFVSRDFQARNILLKEGKPYFIDYQDAMQGPLAYDLASMLYASASGLTDEERSILVEDYYQLLFNQSLPAQEKIFYDQYYPDYKENKDLYYRDFSLCLLIRRLRSLGTYSHLGYQQKKAYFRAQLAPALTEILSFQNQKAFAPFSAIFDLLVQHPPQIFR